MLVRALLALVVVAGCGRIGFDPLGGGSEGDRGDGGGGAGDGGGDGMGPAVGAQVVTSGNVDGSMSSISVPVTGPIAANDVIIVSIGWHDITSNITSVSDSTGNTFSAATIHRGATTVSQNVYWTFSAATSSDTVSVTFSQSVPQGSVRVVVFRGVNTSALMPQGTAGTGNVAAMLDVVPVVNTKVLLTETATTAATGPGSGFTVILTTSFNDIVEQKLATTTGIQTFSTPLASNGEWAIHTIMLPPL